MATTTTEWKPFSPAGDFSPTTIGRYPTLMPGDHVRIKPMPRHINRLGGKEGIFKRQLKVNLLIIIDGQEWKMPPHSIVEYRRGDPSNLEAAESSVVKCDPNGWDDVSPGDFVLIYRNKCEVIQVVAFKNSKVSGRELGTQKTYLYRRDWFVQKLDNSLFT